MKRWVVAFVAALAAACGSPPQAAAPASEPSAPPPQASAPSSSPTVPPTQTAEVPHALAFTASLVGGGQIDGGDLAGRDVVLWFWAPW